MIQVEINFGRDRSSDRKELENAAESYLGTLHGGGQLCGDDIVTWIDDELVVTTRMTGLGAEKRASHTKWGLENLKKVKELFGREPRWTIRDDEKPKRNVSWKGARELVLFTCAFDLKSPIYRADRSESLPVFLLPLLDQVKIDIVHWQDDYILHDRMWLASGTLEMPAYRELTSPESELSREGRELCREVEKATRVPTYYFLMRYYSHPKKELMRPCPSCGGKWRTKAPEDKASFSDWHFRCKRCRLVGNAGFEVNARLAS